MSRMPGLSSQGFHTTSLSAEIVDKMSSSTMETASGSRPEPGAPDCLCRKYELWRKMDRRLPKLIFRSLIAALGHLGPG
jgi:hypothetical protein